VQLYANLVSSDSVPNLQICGMIPGGALFSEHRVVEKGVTFGRAGRALVIDGDMIVLLQALQSFSSALASGQLGPLMREFGLDDTVVSAAQNGGILLPLVGSKNLGFLQKPNTVGCIESGVEPGLLKRPNLMG